MANNGKPPKGKNGKSSSQEVSRLPLAPVLTANASLKFRPFPLCSPLAVSFRHIRPSWRHYIRYVDYAARNGNQAMVRYREAWFELDEKDRIRSWPEQICELADVPPGELVGAVCRAIWEAKAAESSMISSMAHPEVLIVTAKLAKKPDHYRDRELYFRLTGSLPDRQGQSINIFNSAGASNGIKLPDAREGRERLRAFDEETIEMGKTLDAPFLVKDADVSPEDH